MKMSPCPRGAAWILTAVAWLLCFAPTSTQRGPQFYFQNPPAQPARLLPSTFPQSGFNQYQNFFPPVHTGPEAYSPFRPTGSQPPGRALQDSQQQYNLQGYQQQPGIHPSPFQLPPNIPGQVQPQQYSTFQTINPSTSHDQIGTPPAFFQQQQPAYQPIPNHDDIKKTSAAVPTPQSSPQGSASTKYTPRDPNNLRLIQGFSRYQQSPAFEDRFSTTKQPKRTQNGFDTFSENHRTSLFSRPFPIDDIRVNSFVDQRLEVDDAAAGDSKSNSQQTSSIQKDKNPDSTLRKKTNSRTHPNTRNNLPAQRTRLSPSDLRNRAPVHNDSYSREEAETVSNIPTPKFRGRNRDNYFQSTTTTTSAPPTRSRSRFGTTKPPSRLSHQFNVRPTFPSRKITTSSTTEPEPPVDPLVFGSEEVLYDEGYDQDKSAEVSPKSLSTTDPTVIYNVTTFRYTTDKIKDSLGNDSNYSSKEETPVKETSTSDPASTTVDNSENLDTDAESSEVDSSSSAEKEEDNSGENDSREESNRTTHHDDLIDESDVPENHAYWSTNPENNTFVNNEQANEDVSGNATGAFEILTMNPQHVLVEQDNFKTFVDSGLIDATEIPLTSPESIDNVTEQPNVSRPVQSTSTTPETPISFSPPEEKEGRPMEEAIVSVVTTKSVINGSSMLVTMPPVAEVTGQVAPTGQEESSESNSTTSTESWVIVASVQTSRSVSGARFLPPIIRQEERVLPVSGKSFSAETVPKNKGAPTSEERTTKSTASIISTESIIDKLDRVQSELSSGILTGGEVQLEVLTEKPGAILPQMNIGRTTEPPTSTTTYKSPVFIRKFSPHHGSLPPKKNQESSSGIQDDDHPKSKLPGLRPITLQKASTSDDLMNKPQGDQPSLPVTNSKLRNGIRASSGRSSALSSFQNRVKSQDPSSLPSDHKVRTGTSNETKPINIKDFISSLKFEDVSSLLPPGYNASKFVTTSHPKPKESISQANSTTEKNHTNGLLQKARIDDISAFLPPGYKERNQYSSTTAKPNGLESIFQKAAQDDISAFLPPGYEKQAKTSTASPEKNKDFESLFSKAKTDDIKSFLPPGYVTQAKPPSTTTEKTNPLEKLFNKAKQEDISSFLPPGFVPQAKEPSTTEKPSGLESILNGAKAVDINAFLPPGFKLSTEEPVPNVAGGTNNDSSSPESTTKSFKVKFPSVPGMTRRTTLRPTTTTKSFAAPKPSLAPIQKGWPTRVTTLFTGWSTPSTTPIARILETTKTTESTTSTTSTTTTTTTTTTTPQPTTPGICTVNCDLEATIKLVGRDQWIPELLDHNTREWQDMANEVQSQLQSVFTKSESLGQWFRTVRIDDFSQGREGSVLVDYYVELTDLGRQLNTQELKKLFHDSLKEGSPLNEEEVQDDREGERNETSVFNGTDYKSPENLQNLLKLGRFDVDPMYTDFKVVLKHQDPTVGYAEEDIFLPQWAIAGIVIGLASLLFVIIFGVTVLVNRHKNNKKKQPTPLTEDMLNELNKNHMGGLDNYAAEDLYNMEDVWNEKPHEKPPKKRSSASVQENSMSNLYDSWRSEWNGYYYNAYYGNGSSTSGYTRRRSDYDTNF